jgi:sulfur carrier protein
LHITANGKQAELSGEVSITRLLEELKVEMPLYVSVQINDEMIKRENFDSITVKEGDTVEFLHYMGGGSFAL